MKQQPFFEMFGSSTLQQMPGLKLQIMEEQQGQVRLLLPLEVSLMLVVGQMVTRLIVSEKIFGDMTRQIIPGLL